MGRETETGGRELESVTFPIEISKLRELARTFKEDDPVWFDQGAALAAGFAAVPLPPTATVLADHWRENGATFHAQAADLDLSRVLHGEVDWEFERPLRVGDKLTAASALVKDETRTGKRGGEMRMVTIETTYTDGDDEVVARRRDLLIETGSR